MDGVIHNALADFFWFEEFRREVACFWTPETGFLSFSSNNTPGLVDFSWEDIWTNGLQRLSGTPNYPKYAFMFHTHPPGITGMSGIDKNMLAGWRTGLGIPIIYIIVSEHLSHVYLRTKVDGKTVTQDLGEVEHDNLRASEQLLVYVMRGLSKRNLDLREADCRELCLTFNSATDNVGAWQLNSFMASPTMESSIQIESNVL